MTDDDGAQTEAHDPMERGALGAWWWQGLRSAVLLRPDWRRLQVTPSIIACLVMVPFLVSLGVERLYITGDANFYWPGLMAGWLGTAITAWVSWLLIPGSRENTDQHPASAAALFAMMAAQSLTLIGVCGIIFVPLVREGFFASAFAGRWAWWVTWGLAMIWFAATQLMLVWRSGSQRIRPRAIATVLLLGTLSLQLWIQPTRHWYPTPQPNAEADTPEPFKLTQELLELQPQILQSRLQAIQVERPGVVDMYAITFAPYGSEDVFQRESNLVAGVMEQRFDAVGRTLQLVNHRSTVKEWPWATPLNLQRSIQRMAQVMNRDEDVLFIHLTSHGARAGQLSAEFWPLTVDAVTPQMLKAWLDDAGVRYRVISVSACYSGSWVEPLAGPGTLVMTAADADHTSYGCGRKSTLTYFGRAMFDEQLRHTLSFERAHAAARTAIEQREREAGKTDGYSNPQLRVGYQIRERLAKMEDELR